MARRTSPAMAAAVRRGEWERIALALLIGVAQAAREAPPETIDRLIELLAGKEARRDGADG
jgi:hypothetical protein